MFWPMRGFFPIIEDIVFDVWCVRRTEENKRRPDRISVLGYRTSNRAKWKPVWERIGDLKQLIS